MTILDSPIRLSGVKIFNRRSCCGDRLKSVEIRAGKQSVPGNFKARITKNTHCDTFDGPGTTGEIYTVNCDSPIDATVITLQIVASGSQSINIEEIEFIEGVSNRK